VVTSIHGIKRTTFSPDLQTVVTTFTPTNEIPLNPTNVHSWMIKVEPFEKAVPVEAFFVLPKPAPWGRLSGLVSPDRTTALTTFDASAGTTYLSDSWGMHANDPLGDYRIAVFIDRKLAADFRFTVVADPAAVWPTNAPEFRSAPSGKNSYRGKN